MSSFGDRLWPVPNEEGSAELILGLSVTFTLLKKSYVIGAYISCQYSTSCSEL